MPLHPERPCARRTLTSVPWATGLWLVLAAPVAWGQGSLADAASFRSAPTAPQTFKEIKASASLLPDLRKGGYVLYMRHGNTNNDIPDQPTIDLTDCTTQRPLNDEGRAVVKAVGKALKRAHIPVGEVYASPLCRARESAELAFGSTFQTDPLLMYTAHLTAAQKQPVLARTRELLSAPVPTGTNRVLVAHAPNMADLMGYFVKPEGTVVVIQPQGHGHFTYVASIHPKMWSNLVR